VQTQYALRILRAHGLSDSGLHTVFRSVAAAKIMYANRARSGLVNKRDEQRRRVPVAQQPGHLIDSNFITRILYENIYWRYHLTVYTFTQGKTDILSILPREAAMMMMLARSWDRNSVRLSDRLSVSVCHKHALRRN